MTRSSLLALIAVFAFGAARAADDDIAYIAGAPISGVPTGAYKTWTDDQKAQVLKRIGAYCEFMCVDPYGNASFPNQMAADRARAHAKVCLKACVVGHLPKDYPDYDGMKTDLRNEFDSARKLGLTLDWPFPKG